MNVKNELKKCHNCKYFINITKTDDVFICGQCMLENKYVIDADNEFCENYEDLFDFLK